jgi:hypothetical protein
MIRLFLLGENVSCLAHPCLVKYQAYLILEKKMKTIPTMEEVRLFLTFSNVNRIFLTSDIAIYYSIEVNHFNLCVFYKPLGYVIGQSLKHNFIIYKSVCFFGNWVATMYRAFYHLLLVV